MNEILIFYTPEDSAFNTLSVIFMDDSLLILYDLFMCPRVQTLALNVHINFDVDAFF